MAKDHLLTGGALRSRGGGRMGWDGACEAMGDATSPTLATILDFSP